MQIESPILIDVTRLILRLLKGKRATGVDRVSLAYLEYFRHRALAVLSWRARVVVLSVSKSQLIFEKLIADNQRDDRDRWYWIQTLAHLATFVRVDKNYVGAYLFNTGHKGLESQTYTGTLKKMQVRPIFFVHDLIPLTHPEYCRAGEYQQHQQRMLNVLNSAAGTITNSQATLDELVRFAQEQGISMPPSVVAPLASAKLENNPSKRLIAEPYFVVLSTIEPRKNHWMLLQVWRRLVEEMGAQAPKLLIIGQRGWECENVIDLLERCKELRGFVMELPSCNDVDLANYLHYSQALLFPSFAEGYGMPLAEALALGVPAIASRLPAFLEISDDIPEFLDPLDGIAWQKHIKSYARIDSPERQAQLERLTHFEPSTWDQHFVQVEWLLRHISGSV